MKKVAAKDEGDPFWWSWHSVSLPPSCEVPHPSLDRCLTALTHGAAAPTLQFVTQLQCKRPRPWGQLPLRTVGIAVALLSVMLAVADGSAGATAFVGGAQAAVQPPHRGLVRVPAELRTRFTAERLGGPDPPPPGATRPPGGAAFATLQWWLYRRSRHSGRNRR